MDAWINPLTRDYERVRTVRLAPGRYDITPERIGAFRRPSIATAQIGNMVATVGVDVPRFENGQLLIEDERTNLLRHSQQLDNPSWWKTVVGTGSPPVVTGNAGIAPDGTPTATRVQLALNGGGSNGSNWSGLVQQLTVQLLQIGSRCQGSFWAMATTLSEVGKTIGCRHVAGATYTKHVLTGDWQRFSVSEVAASTSTHQLQIILRGSFGLSDSADFLVWGVQLEEGPTPTSYIPTGSSPVTRAADECTAILSDPVGAIGNLVRAPGNGLANACYLRLMTPLGSWFGDRTLGSRLHELQREKDVPRVERLARQYARDALRPLLADGRARSIEVATERSKDATAGGRLLLAVEVVDAIGMRRTFRYPVRVR